MEHHHRIALGGRLWPRAGIIAGTLAFATAGPAWAGLVPQNQSRLLYGLAIADDPLVPGITEDGGTFLNTDPGGYFRNEVFTANEGSVSAQVRVQQSSISQVDFMNGAAVIELLAGSTLAGGGTQASASNDFEVAFNVETPTLVSFAGQVADGSLATIRVDGPNGNVVRVDWLTGPQVWQGLLPVGSYIVEARFNGQVQSSLQPAALRLDSWEFSLQAVPAPATSALGLLAVIGRRRRRRT